MKNPFERSTPREKYDETKGKIAEERKKIEKLEHPVTYEQTKPIQDRFPELSIGDLAVARGVYEIADSIFSIPNIPEIKFRELKVGMARKKLAKIYERSHDDALKLNEEYNRLVEQVVAGKKTERELHAFEVNKLGM